MPRRHLLLLLLAVAPAAAAAVPDLGGTWAGDASGGGAAVTVTCTLAQQDRDTVGTCAVTGAGADGTWSVDGRLRSGALRLHGRRGDGARLQVVGRPRDGGLTARIRVRGGGLRVIATGRLTRADGGGGGSTPPSCGDAWFAEQVMPRVISPICVNCHVAGGAAASARFRVTPGDAAATAASAYALVNTADPSASLILRKPQALVAHGGGQQLVPGSELAQVLIDWVTRVTDPACGGGGGGGGPDTRPAAQRLYEDTCGSCHGTDGRGMDGRPSIRCTTDVAPTVRAGQGAMPAFSTAELSDADLALIQSWLAGLCASDDPTAAAADLYAGNCARCHGADGQGGTSSDGVHGPDIRCKDVGDFLEVVPSGEERMPAFPTLTSPQIQAIAAHVRDPLCAGGDD